MEGFKIILKSPSVLVKDYFAPMALKKVNLLRYASLLPFRHTFKGAWLPGYSRQAGFA